MLSLFVLVELPSEEPVRFVGVYVLRWGKEDEPEVAFREATDEEILAKAQYISERGN